MKAVIVIDMPNSCSECPLGDIYEGQYCGVADAWIAEGTYKPEWCPLRPLPNRRGKATLTERSQDTDMIAWQLKSNLHSEGWNDCLDEILGKTE